uniref:Uncharacterized protein n=1 Tax=Timema cristinae TaxID=61476 RepID=A0A7R9D669_TIMCR|nr:unnamed protein product [Timema cristinae]
MVGYFQEAHVEIVASNSGLDFSTHAHVFSCRLSVSITAANVFLLLRQLVGPTAASYWTLEAPDDVR